MKPVDPVKTARIALRVAKNSLNRADGGRTLDKSGFFSKAEEVAKNLPQQRGNVDQMLAMMAKNGVKPAEMLAVGRPFGHSISKQELADHFNRNAPRVLVTKYNKDGWDEGDDSTSYSDYALNGGSKYREHLLHLKSNASPNDPPRFKMYNTPDGGTVTKKKVAFGDHQSSHWPEVPNILAHLRMQEFKNPVSNPEYDEAKKNYDELYSNRNAAHAAFVKANAALKDADRKGELTPELKEANDKAYKNFNNASSLAVAAGKDLAKVSKLEKVLHLEELQSDWAQEGRSKGFYDPKNPLTLYKTTTTDKGDLQDEIVGHFPHEDAVSEHLNSMPKEDTEGYWYKNRRAGDDISEVPMGPFVTNTQHWMDLGLKHLLYEAAKGKHDKISWTPGSEQVERFGIENHVGEIAYDPENKMYTIKDPEGDELYGDSFDSNAPDTLKNLIGKELSEKLLKTEPKPYVFSKDSDPSNAHILSGLDLKVGGDGMKKYYDEMLPKSLLKLARQHDPDAKLVPHVIKDTPPSFSRRSPIEINTQALVITPKMRESILRGQSLFASGGAVNPDPTDAQKEVGNYKKEHVSFQGIPVSIENKKGSMRSGTSKNGRHWSVEMPYDYGYVKGTKGADGDHVDVCIGPNSDSDTVFVVDQKDANTGKFDEHKAMLGYRSLADAEKAYCLGFSDGKGHLRMGPIVRMTISEFKSWLKTEETKTANKKQSLVDNALKLVRRQ